MWRNTYDSARSARSIQDFLLHARFIRAMVCAFLMDLCFASRLEVIVAISNGGLETILHGERTKGPTADRICWVADAKWH